MNTQILNLVQLKISRLGAGEMAQQVRELAAKSDHLSSIPRTHRVEGNNHLHKLTSDLHAHAIVSTSPPHARECPRTCTHTHTLIN